jgi:hypothetical protein
MKKLFYLSVLSCFFILGCSEKSKEKDKNETDMGYTAEADMGDADEADMGDADEADMGDADETKLNTSKIVTNKNATQLELTVMQMIVIRKNIDCGHYDLTELDWNKYEDQYKKDYNVTDLNSIDGWEDTYFQLSNGINILEQEATDLAIMGCQEKKARDIGDAEKREQLRQLRKAEQNNLELKYNVSTMDYILGWKNTRFIIDYLMKDSSIFDKENCKFIK